MNIIKVSLDGGATWQVAPCGVRVIYEDVLVPGEDEKGQLHLNATHEGIITDVWVTGDVPLDHNIGTSSKTIDDMVCEMVDDRCQALW